MKKYFKHIFVGVLSVFALTSCLSEYEYTPGEPEDANCAAVYFEEASAKYEIEPGSITSVPVTLCRPTTEGEVSVPLFLKSGDVDVWTIPSTVTFRDGEDKATISVAFNNIPDGESREALIAIDPAAVSTYGNVGTSFEYNVSVSLVKWEKSPEPGYWIDGIVCSIFNIDVIPMAVEYEKAVLPSGEVRFRFNPPYSIESPNDGQSYLDEAFVQLDDDPDHVAWVGFPYNSVNTLTGEWDQMLITAKGKEASLAPFSLGCCMNPQYGAISSGSIYGYLSSNKSSYPLGAVEEANGHTTITFGEKSLYWIMDAYNPENPQVCAQTSVFTTDPAKVVELLYKAEEYDPTSYTYTPLYIGSYQHAVGVFGNSKPVWQDQTGATYAADDMIMYSTKDKENVYMLKPFIMNGGAMYFVWNEDNSITVLESYTGYTDEEVGPVYTSDLVSLGNSAEYKSYVDTRTYTFVFNLGWYCSAGAIGFTQDTYVVSDLAGVRPAKANKKAIKRIDPKHPFVFKLVKQNFGDVKLK